MSENNTAVIDARKSGLLADITGCETVNELVAMDLGELSGDKDVKAALAAAVARFAGVQPGAKRTGGKRTVAEKVYRLVKTEVAWATQPQVHGLMSIIKGAFNVGDEIPESKIVELVTDPRVEATILRTKQGGAKIWDYYKGGHERGFIAHGNFEIVEAAK